MKYWLVIIVFISSYTFSQEKIFDSYHQLMGVDFIISVVCSDSIKASEEISFAVAETKRIEKIISSWDKESHTSEINLNAGNKPVQVAPELYELIKRSIKVSELTDGAFDVTVGPLIDLWKVSLSNQIIPTKTLINQALLLVDYQSIKLNDENQTVYLEKKGMKLGFGAIGKGYVAELIKEELIQRGIKAGMISAGGDLVVWGNHPQKQHWSIGIADPDKKGDLIGYVRLNENAIVTSGNYEKFIEIDGERYTHIINPTTGQTVKGLKSVSVICPNAELADALATACFVLGLEEGIELINKLDGIEALFIDTENNIQTTNTFNYDKSH